MKGYDRLYPLSSTRPSCSSSQGNRLCVSGYTVVPIDGRFPKMIFILSAQD